MHGQLTKWLEVKCKHGGRFVVIIQSFDDEYPTYNRIHLPRVNPFDSKR